MADNLHIILQAELMNVRPLLHDFAGENTRNRSKKKFQLKESNALAQRVKSHVG